jgi:hypothetical protein
VQVSHSQAYSTVVTEFAVIFPHEGQGADLAKLVIVEVETATKRASAVIIFFI